MPLIPVYPARLVAADITVDNYSLLTPTPPSGETIYTVDFTIKGIASVSVQPDGETVYAVTMVETKEALVEGTSTLTTLFSKPTTIVRTYYPPASALYAVLNAALETFAEDASRLDQSVMTTSPFSVPGLGMGMVDSVSIQLVCTGAVGAAATCIDAEAESLTGGGMAYTFTETFPAVRTPLFTIISSGARAVGPPALGVMALVVGVVRALVKCI